MIVCKRFFSTAGREESDDERAKKKKLRPVVQNLIITSLITLFFLAVVFIYYNSVYDKTRENILLNAEMNAVRAANTIDVPDPGRTHMPRQLSRAPQLSLFSRVWQPQLLSPLQ